MPQNSFQYFASKPNILKRKLPQKSDSRRPSLEPQERSQPKDHPDPLPSISQSLFTETLSDLHPSALSLSTPSDSLPQSLSHPLKSKCNISISSPIQEDISKMKLENCMLNGNLHLKEEELKTLTLNYQADMQTNTLREKELHCRYEKNKSEYQACINSLKGRLDHLNKTTNIFTDCFQIQIKKESDQFICSTTKDQQEVLFSFTPKHYYTTYTPLQVNFPANSFLSHQIEDMNRTELNLLFMRLLKIIYNS